jgi:hypothetical protein
VFIFTLLLVGGIIGMVASLTRKFNKAAFALSAVAFFVGYVMLK